MTCNPPYMNGNWGFLSPSDKKALARHEITINIDDVAKISAYLLKCGGYFSMVHRAERLCDVICAMRKYKNRAETHKICSFICAKCAETFSY
ncbi:MAG: hypothetical protein L6V93_07135 [Clostridiales bacterium]|nr:MAG: hypothetical protein L6V93_07135 [Clostridiales bacterium]